MYGTHMILRDCAADPVDVWPVEPIFSCKSTRPQTEVREGKEAGRGRGGEGGGAHRRWGFSVNALFYCIIAFAGSLRRVSSDVATLASCGQSTRKKAKTVALQDRELLPRVTPRMLRGP